ncbi:cupin domain-containing protein [Salipiger marinus]|uniref:Cupin n=1 Tax=Salipiger marinus TaxID=555512 RepID=A0A1G8KRR8_9RHOB|nr:cupin domain-containing protein [Salipiger marinus]SDI46063.1 Cupin [Salipiger marinus]
MLCHAVDPLSHLLALLKPRSCITAGGDRGLGLDDLAGRIKCDAAIRGDCWLAMADAAPVHLRTGDCLVRPSGRFATKSSSPGHPDRSGQVVT